MTFQKGYQPSEETKRKMSESAKLRKGKNAGFYGHKHSEESKKKMSIATIGSNHPNWKGGIRKDKDGYVLIWKPDHPNAEKTGLIRRSRLVAEKMLGRYLYSWELVHHKNETRDDDRPENLGIMTRSEHYKHHRNIQILNSKGGQK